MIKRNQNVSREKKWDKKIIGKRTKSLKKEKLWVKKKCGQKMKGKKANNEKIPKEKLPYPE